LTGDRSTTSESVDRLVTLAQSTFTDDLSSNENEVFDRLAKGMHAPTRNPRLRWFALVLSFAAAVALATIAVGLVHRTRHLSFRVTGGSRSTEGADDPRTAGRIDFSDGSFVALQPSARASVTDIDDHGAHVHLERGELHTRFVRAKAARWVVDAGPYLVTVAGTTFDIAWTPAEQTMEVWVLDGSVVVKGPLADLGISIATGQHLRANLVTGRVLLDRIDRMEESSDAIEDDAPAASPQGADYLRRLAIPRSISR
jgi:ferric-dicitrate binding protein FerR (iron transport regulator)